MSTTGHIQRVEDVKEEVIPVKIKASDALLAAVREELDREVRATMLDGREPQKQYPYMACPRAERSIDPLQKCDDCGGVGYHESIRNPYFKKNESLYGAEHCLSKGAPHAPESKLPGRYLERLNSEQRKQHPMCEGLLDYFPDALALIAHLSWVGNEKHNKGEPLHHARSKSTDEIDCVVRHVVTRDEYDVYDIDGVEYQIPHWVSAAWRILAYGQKKMEEDLGLDLPKGARP